MAWLAALNVEPPKRCAVLRAALSGDRAALEALYQATGGPNWERSDNWLTDAPVGDWYGVGVDSEGRVSILWLHGNALSGPIPPEIGKLTALEVLLLDDNALSGSIPPEIGNLDALVELILHGNRLSGPIPPGIGNLTALDGLSFFDNALSGPIPPELGSLEALRLLRLEDNDLSGPIPLELANLAALEQLKLDGNPGLCAPDDSRLLAWLAGPERATAPALRGRRVTPGKGEGRCVM